MFNITVKWKNGVVTAQEIKAQCPLQAVAIHVANIGNKFSYPISVCCERLA